MLSQDDRRELEEIAHPLELENPRFAAAQIAGGPGYWPWWSPGWCSVPVPRRSTT
jgi:hypothetical protein